MGNGVEEGVLPLVAAYFADQEDGVKDDAGGEQREDDDPQDEDGELALVEDDPADVERDGRAQREYAKGDEEGDSSASSGDVHGVEKSIVASARWSTKSAARKRIEVGYLRQYGS